MVKLWYVNGKTKEIKSYNIFDDNMTDFPRKEFVKYQKYIVTGFESKELAEKWLFEKEMKKWSVEEKNC